MPTNVIPFSNFKIQTILLLMASLSLGYVGQFVDGFPLRRVVNLRVVARHAGRLMADYTARNKEMNIARYAVEKRTRRKEADCRSKHMKGTETVSHPATNRNKHCQTQRVTRQHGLHV